MTRRQILKDYGKTKVAAARLMGQETELLILMLTDTVSNPTEALEITQSACKKLSLVSP